MTAYAERALDALGDPTRRLIFKRLRRGARSVGEIARGMDVSRPAVSQHLKVLKDAGIVRGTIDGPNRCYCLEPEAVAWLKREFAALSESCC